MGNATSRQGTESQGGHPAVLVADDDASNREVLRALMEELPYPVLDAADVDATQRILRTSTSGLVLVLDVLLPTVEDGVAVLQSVRETGRHAVVGITASPRQITPRVHELLDALNAPLVTKPFDIDALLTCVAAAARRLESTQEMCG